MNNMHSNRVKKYEKHVKKDERYPCKLCDKTFHHTSRLKIHYRNDHKKEEVKEEQKIVGNIWEKS